MAIRIPKVDADCCLACGNCEAVCPEVFRLNEALGYSEVINPRGASEERIQDAMDQCPAQCIDWEEGES
ncbi:MAG: ferredoxin [Deltaproteobacteria bacterium]|nr:ferredoxin [Deltaproteobacteria bacterium]